MGLEACFLALNSSSCFLSNARLESAKVDFLLDVPEWISAIAASQPKLKRRTEGQQRQTMKLGLPKRDKYRKIEGMMAK